MPGRLAKIRMTVMLGKALFVVLLIGLPLFAPSSASAEEPPKRVLIFSSDDQFIPGVTILNQSIRSTMKNGLQVPIQFFYEAQDGFRISNEKYEEELLRLLQRKYDGEHLDLIYVLAPPALKFLLKYQSQLFSNIPIVFIVTDLNRVEGLGLTSNVTGVGGKIEFSPNRPFRNSSPGRVVRLQ